MTGQTNRTMHRAAHPSILLVLVLLLPAVTSIAAPIQGACTGATDATPRVALISAFSGEADRFIDEMQVDNDANSFEGCVVVNGHRFTKEIRGHNIN